jgi:2-hydroxy-3-oxopropionate reductase
MLSGDDEPGFRLSLHRKDLAIALRTAREEQVPLPATAQAAEIMNALLARGRDDADSAVIGELYAQLAGLSGAVPATAGER